jgi:hypothetical protein
VTGGLIALTVLLLEINPEQLKDLKDLLQQDLTVVPAGRE